jgi:hypothetical protein
MGAGDAPRPDAERPPAGLRLGSGRGPLRVGAAAQARAVDPTSRGDAVAPAEAGSARPRGAPCAAPARSRHRPAGPPSGPS